MFYITAFVLFLGASHCVLWAASVIAFVYKYFFRPPTDLSKYLRDDAWALITGASEGIGKAYAFELAKRGFNVILLSRSEVKLEKVANAIRKYISFNLDRMKLCQKTGDLYYVKTKVIVIDFSKLSLEIYKALKDSLQDLNIQMLVNNVGIAYPKQMYFLNTPLSLHDSIIDVNIKSLHMMTYLVLPQMVKQ